jgi:RecA/RadA recombinase
MIRGRARAENPKGGKYLTGPDQANRIYNVDDLADADDVIITEGEFDCLMLKQLLMASPELKYRNIAVIGLPGTQALPDNFESYFTNVKRIFVGFDGDEAGRKGAQAIKDKLGVKVRVLSFPHDVIERAMDAGKTDKDHDWSTLIKDFGLTWQHVAQMISTSAGKRVFSMAEAGLTYRQVQEDRAVIKTGITSLDGMIGGGFKYGQVIIFLAKTGAGKTQILCNLAYYMRSYKFLYVTLEMTREEIYERLSKIYRFWNPLASDEVLEEALSNVYICDENKLSERGLDQIVDEFEMESGVRPDVVCVDYLGYFARGMSGNTPYEKNGNAVMELKASAKGGSSLDPRKRYLCIVPAQVNRGANEGKPIGLDDARDAGTIEETADFLFSLYRPDDALSASDITGNVRSSGKVKMECLKARGPGKGRTITLQADALTLAMVEDGTSAAYKAKEHNDHAQRGLDYNGLRKQELAPVQMKMKGT